MAADEVQLEIERDGSGSGNVNCHVFVISDSQMNIQGQHLDSVHYYYPRLRTLWITSKAWSPFGASWESG